MQNRYAGDVGDFGKLGLLRHLAGTALTLGINWYLTADEDHNADGKFIDYVKDKRFSGLDDALLECLAQLVAGERSVTRLEKLDLLSGARYFHDVLESPSPSFSRNQWHRKAVASLRDADIVFLDPDNGLLVKSVARTSPKSRKYALPEEFVDYFAAGKSVIVYNHRSRERKAAYLKRFDWMVDSPVLKHATLTGVTYKRGTIRDYIFAIRPEHRDVLLASLNALFQSKWQVHFEALF